MHLIYGMYHNRILVPFGSPTVDFFSRSQNYILVKINIRMLYYVITTLCCSF